MQLSAQSTPPALDFLTHPCLYVSQCNVMHLPLEQVSSVSLSVTVCASQSSFTFASPNGLSHA